MKINERMTIMNTAYKQWVTGAEESNRSNAGKPEEEASILGRLLIGSYKNDRKFTEIPNNTDDCPPSVANEESSGRTSGNAQLDHT